MGNAFKNSSSHLPLNTKKITPVQKKWVRTNPCTPVLCYRGKCNLRRQNPWAGHAQPWNGGFQEFVQSMREVAGERSLQERVTKDVPPVLRVVMLTPVIALWNIFLFIQIKNQQNFKNPVWQNKLKIIPKWMINCTPIIQMCSSIASLIFRHISKFQKRQKCVAQILFYIHSRIFHEGKIEECIGHGIDHASLRFGFSGQNGGKLWKKESTCEIWAMNSQDHNWKLPNLTKMQLKRPKDGEKERGETTAPHNLTYDTYNRQNAESDDQILENTIFVWNEKHVALRSSYDSLKYIFFDSITVYLAKWGHVRNWTKNTEALVQSISSERR